MCLKKRKIEDEGVPTSLESAYFITESKVHHRKWQEFFFGSEADARRFGGQRVSPGINRKRGRTVKRSLPLGR